MLRAKATLSYQILGTLLTRNFPTTSMKLGLTRSSEASQIWTMPPYGLLATKRIILDYQVSKFGILSIGVLITGTGIEYGVWDFQWKVNLPYTSSNEVSQACWLVIADYQTGDIFNASQTLVFQAADAFETTLPSVVTSYILSTATMVSFTAAATGPSVDTSTDPSKDSESDSDKGTDKSSNNQTWIGIAAALGGVWVLTLLGLAGFCFHRSRKQRLRQKEEIQPISSISVPYVAQNPEPGPPLTSEMSSTRQSPDLNPSMMGRESLTALPSTEGRSLTHQSVVSELAG